MATHAADRSLGGGLDSESQMDIIVNEDATMYELTKDLNRHTTALNDSVLSLVGGMRERILGQARKLVEGERARSREYERRLLAQIEGLQRLLDQRTKDLDAEQGLSERLVTTKNRQAKRRGTLWIVREGFRRWRRMATDNNRLSRNYKFLCNVRRERIQRLAFNEWRHEVKRLHFTTKLSATQSQFQRDVARLRNEHQTSENTMTLELIAMREKLAKEEERRAILEERLKAAFMRGVCALNMEAMQVLRNAPHDGDVSVASLLQAINLTSSSADSVGAQPPTTDRLLHTQETLQAQLAEMQSVIQQQHHPNTAAGPGGGGEPSVFRTTSPIRGAGKTPQPYAMQPRPEPLVVSAPSQQSVLSTSRPSIHPPVRVTMHEPPAASAPTAAPVRPRSAAPGPRGGVNMQQPLRPGWRK